MKIIQKLIKIIIDEKKYFPQAVEILFFLKRKKHIVHSSGRKVKNFFHFQDQVIKMQGWNNEKALSCLLLNVLTSERRHVRQTPIEINASQLHQSEDNSL